jgi:AcrR family transcriptional regulator
VYRLDVADHLNTVKTESADDSAEAPYKARYHHGALREALIAAGESILEERGVEKFSLREAARRAGVSAGAPAHHFGDARGLMTAIAVRAYDQLTAALTTAEEAAGPERDARVRAQGVAYVRFAWSHRAKFDLMWRRALLDLENAELNEAANAAFGALGRAIGAPSGEVEASSDPCAPEGPPPSSIAAWSIVHGYARLALDGAFDPWTPGLLDGVLDRLDV